MTVDQTDELIELKQKHYGRKWLLSTRKETLKYIWKTGNSSRMLARIVIRNNVHWLWCIVRVHTINCLCLLCTGDMLSDMFSSVGWRHDCLPRVPLPVTAPCTTMGIMTLVCQQTFGNVIIDTQHVGHALPKGFHNYWIKKQMSAKSQTNDLHTALTAPRKRH